MVKWLEGLRDVCIILISCASFSFIGCMLIESYEIKEFPHAGADPEAIYFFDFIAIEIGGDVGEHLESMKKIVAGQHDLGHDGYGVAVMLYCGFQAKIIETIGSGIATKLAEGVFGVSEHCIVSFIGKLLGDISAGANVVPLFCG